MGFLSKLKHYVKKLVGKISKEHVEEVAEEVKEKAPVTKKLKVKNTKKKAKK